MESLAGARVTQDKSRTSQEHLTNNAPKLTEAIEVILYSDYIRLFGGHSTSDSPVIVLPDSCRVDVTANELERTLQYLISLLPEHEVDGIGVTLVADRRKQSWASVLNLLNNIFNCSVLSVICHVFVLRPSGFLRTFENLFDDVSRRVAKSGFSDKVTVLNRLEDLYRYVDYSELTPDLGGMLTYYQQDWIKQAKAAEQLSESCRHVAILLDAAHGAVKEFHSDAGSLHSIKLQSKLLEASVLQMKAIEELHETVSRAESLLKEFANMTHVGEFIGDQCTVKKAGRIVQSHLHMKAVQKLIVHMEEAERGFLFGWTAFEETTKDTIRRKQFQERRLHASATVSKHLSYLESLTADNNTVTGVGQHLEKLQNFESSSHEDIGDTEELLLEWKQFRKSITATITATTLKNTTSPSEAQKMAPSSETNQSKISQPCDDREIVDSLNADNRPAQLVDNLSKEDDVQDILWAELRASCDQYHRILAARYQQLLSS